MEDDAHNAVPCSSPAVESINRAGLAGAIWGLCIGPYKATQQGTLAKLLLCYKQDQLANMGFNAVNIFVSGIAIGAAIAAGTGRIQPVWVVTLFSVLCVFADPSASN